MEKERDIILVPWEFKERNIISLRHAIQLAKAADNEILFFHVSKKKGFLESRRKKDEALDKARKELVKISDKFTIDNGIKSTSVVKEGNLEKTLNETIQEFNVNLIVTHSDYSAGEKGPNIMQLVKTTKKSSIPFILTQNNPKHNHYIEIVIPIDYDRKFKETVRWVMHLSKYYKCNLNFIKPYYDDDEKKRLMANNIYFTKKMLDANEIIYGIKTAKKNKNFSDEIYNFAHKIDADLVVFMSTSYKRHVLNTNKTDKYTFEQKIEIPVMCINPLSRKYKGFY